MSTTTAIDRASPEYQAALWERSPTAELWPALMDAYEAAAYKRINYHTILRACKVARTDGKARLPHQRFGTAYRITKRALDAFGLVEGRELAGARGGVVVGLMGVLVFVLILAAAVRGAVANPVYQGITAGISMLPAVKPGEHIIIEVVPFAQLRVGDIVVKRDIWRGNMLVGHRIVRAGGWFQHGWITRGDNNEHDDPGLLTPENYIGREVLIERDVVFSPTIFHP